MKQKNDNSTEDVLLEAAVDAVLTAATQKATEGDSAAALQFAEAYALLYGFDVGR